MRRRRVRDRRGRAGALRRTRERAGEVPLVHDADPVLDVHPHQPPADFPGPGVGQQTLLRARWRLPLLARGSRSAPLRPGHAGGTPRPSRRPRLSRATPPRSPTGRRRRDCGRTTARPRRTWPIGRAAIGSPESQRSRSAATASADAITPARGLSPGTSDRSPRGHDRRAGRACREVPAPVLEPAAVSRRPMRPETAAGP